MNRSEFEVGLKAVAEQAATVKGISLDQILHLIQGILALIQVIWGDQPQPAPPPPAPAPTKGK